jgi:hypothetical protein
MNPTEPFTTGFGAIPRPEEPARFEPQPYVAAPPGMVPGAHYSTVVQPSSPTITVAPVQTTIFTARSTSGGYTYRRPCNHVLHASLTLITCGLWAPVWIVAWAVARQR